MPRPIRTMLAAVLSTFAGAAIAQETPTVSDPRAGVASLAWSAEANRTPLAGTAPVRHLPFSVAPNFRAASTGVPVGQMPAPRALDYAFHNAGGNGSN